MPEVQHEITLGCGCRVNLSVNLSFDPVDFDVCCADDVDIRGTMLEPCNLHKPKNTPERVPCSSIHCESDLLVNSCHCVLEQGHPGKHVCACGNVRGRYAEDGMTIEVKFKDIGDARVVGITNGFLAEHPEPFDLLKLANTLFGEGDSYIIITFPFTTNDVKYLEE